MYDGTACPWLCFGGGFSIIPHYASTNLQLLRIVETILLLLLWSQFVLNCSLSIHKNVNSTKFIRNSLFCKPI